MAKSISFKTQDARNKYMQSLGVFKAALGGTFGFYRTVTDAWANVLDGKGIFDATDFTDADFDQFAIGFKAFQDIRISMQILKAQAQAQMTDVLASDDVIQPDCYPVVKTYKDVFEMIAAQDAAKAEMIELAAQAKVKQSTFGGG